MEILKKFARKAAEIVIVALGTIGLETGIKARQGDWSTVATLLLMGLCWAGVVFGAGAIVRNHWKRSKAKKAAAAAEQRKEESLAKVFRMASVSALDLRRLYLRLHGEQIDIDDQDDPNRSVLGHQNHEPDEGVLGRVRNRHTAPDRRESRVVQHSGMAGLSGRADPSDGARRCGGGPPEIPSESPLSAAGLMFLRWVRWDSPSRALVTEGGVEPSEAGHRLLSAEADLWDSAV